MDPTIASGQLFSLSALDLQAIDVIGMPCSKRRNAKTADEVQRTRRTSIGASAKRCEHVAHEPIELTLIAVTYQASTGFRKKPQRVLMNRCQRFLSENPTQPPGAIVFVGLRTRPRLLKDICYVEEGW